LRIVLSVVLFLLTSAAAYAQRDPLIGPEQFPEYRNLSGLAGGGYGVDSQGFASLSGPVALSSPNAHVLGRSQWRVNFAAASFSSSPEFSQARTNGTLTFTYGQTFGRINIAGTHMFLSAHPEYADNLQIQLIPRERERMVFSAGVQGLIGANKSQGDNEPNDKRDSRSFFGVATYRVDTTRSPLYLSAGLGTRRFKHGFGSASYQAVKPIRLWVEHDGFGVNEGILYTYKPADKKRGFELNVSAGYLNARYFVFSTGVGF